ncbi:hypothetical protein [Fictibacillus phosphorivorans]|uniref:hypothetical protein n=1 Tax=Fictibacillus phosphorivorans TaxID=1221500 RepID=UPI00204015FE|nr:hypothetical protein [Fictibacillus phosphorivorans]MCM3719799.1 hypothetical protein [Fictibacillus phosphorivorans]MCM3777530.1 hypothetical protein [Fictibacillus phosphorivorans]
MTKSEKKWRRFYGMMYIFIYGIYVPYNLFMWLGSEEGFPFGMIGIAIGLPLIKKNHINSIHEKEQNI